MQVKIYYQLKLLFQEALELHHIFISFLKGRQDDIMYLRYLAEVIKLFYSLFLHSQDLRFFRSIKLDSSKHENDLKIKKIITRIKANSFCIIFNSLLKLFQLSIGKTTITVKISLSTINFNRIGKISNCIFGLTLFIETYASIVIAISIIGINF